MSNTPATPKINGESQVCGEKASASVVASGIVTSAAMNCKGVNS
ncbi:hypothetical protein [Methanosarcina sp. 2.H.T.1A.15]|nr:hypothetical protein [Methanosarcina sp. 2.H.T.1A.15]